MTNKPKPGPGYTILTEITNSIFEQSRSLDDEKLQKLVDLPKTLTQTNCGWIQYLLSGPAAEVAANELQLRKSGTVC